eukprot:5244708-Amphidinium_carterae.1
MVSFKCITGCHVERWIAHPEAKAMQATLKLIDALRPSFGVAENVRGFAVADADGSQSALEYFQSSLASHGYSSEVVDA